MKAVNLEKIPETAITHNPKVKKRVIFDKGYIPKLTTFSQAILKPDHSIPLHKHDTMYEVFYILKGRVLFVINEKRVVATKNDVISIEPGELHAQKNPFSNPVTWLYFGIAID